MKKYYKIGFWLPPDLDSDKLVAMFNYNNILVDDTCSTHSTRGRLVSLWITAGELEETNLDEKPGSFWGVNPGKEPTK